jgi:hypothetical protein
MLVSIIAQVSKVVARACRTGNAGIFFDIVRSVNELYGWEWTRRRRAADTKNEDGCWRVPERARPAKFPDR